MAAQGPKNGLWFTTGVMGAVGVSLLLGFANLAVPSIWHDEAVQVIVSRNLAETGRPVLPSGNVHPVAPVFNAVMACFIKCFGDSETAVRSPAVLFGAVNVVLTFCLVRTLLGRTTALVAAFSLALSPWAVAWAREARFYASHQTFYLLFLWISWQLIKTMDTDRIALDTNEGRRGNRTRETVLWLVAAGALYVLSVGTSLHSVLFLGPLGAYAFLMLPFGRHARLRWMAMVVFVAIIGLTTMIVYRLTLPGADARAIFNSAGLGMHLGDSEGIEHLYYFRWLWQNLSVAFFALAMLGFLLMVIRGGKPGIFAALAFWVPVMALTVLVEYRRHRFMFFAYPMYVAAHSYALVELVRFAFTARRSWIRAVATAAIVIFLARTGVSTIRLIGDSITVARGADISLATRHPQWRKPCLYVRERLTPETAVLTTTFMPTLYYVGRVDDWFPSGPVFYEYAEIGTNGLATTDDLAAFMAQHPSGFFLAEWFRFLHFDFQEPDREWVRAHMTLLEEASSGDVKLFAWGDAAKR